MRFGSADRTVSGGFDTSVALLAAPLAMANATMVTPVAMVLILAVVVNCGYWPARITPVIDQAAPPSARAPTECSETAAGCRCLKERDTNTSAGSSP